MRSTSSRLMTMCTCAWTACPMPYCSGQTSMQVGMQPLMLHLDLPPDDTARPARCLL
jgi:hypothetical protein